jgi:AraC family transcriptional regulator
MGPYDKLPEAYEAMELWIQSQGLIAAGPPWESYVTDPSEHPDPKDWKTEIFWPLVS